MTDDAAGYSRLEAAGEYRAFSLGYEAIIVREGNSVDSLISRDQSLPENPRKLLFETFNPGFRNKSLKSGDLLWLPTTTPYSGKFWNGFDPYSNNTWSDFSKNYWDGTRLDTEISSALEELKKLEVDSAEAANWKAVETSLFNIQKSATYSGLSAKSFASLEGSVAGIQSAAYLRSLMVGMSSANYNLRPQELALVASSAENKTVAVGSGRIKVIVQTKSPKNGQICGLRVFRASPLSFEAGCMYRNKIEFDTRSYSASALVPIAKWLVWAEDSQGRRSDPRAISIYDDADDGRVFDLTVNWLPK